MVASAQAGSLYWQLTANDATFQRVADHAAATAVSTQQKIVAAAKQREAVESAMAAKRQAADIHTADRAKLDQTIHQQKYGQPDTSGMISGGRILDALHIEKQAREAVLVSQKASSAETEKQLGLTDRLTNRAIKLGAAVAITKVAINALDAVGTVAEARATERAGNIEGALKLQESAIAKARSVPIIGDAVYTAISMFGSWERDIDKAKAALERMGRELEVIKDRSNATREVLAGSDRAIIGFHRQADILEENPNQGFARQRAEIEAGALADYDAAGARRTEALKTALGQDQIDAVENNFKHEMKQAERLRNLRMAENKKDEQQEYENAVRRIQFARVQGGILAAARGGDSLTRFNAEREAARREIGQQAEDDIKALKRFSGGRDTEATRQRGAQRDEALSNFDADTGEGRKKLVADREQTITDIETGARLRRLNLLGRSDEAELDALRAGYDKRIKAAEDANEAMTAARLRMDKADAELDLKAKQKRDEQISVRSIQADTEARKLEFKGQNMNAALLRLRTDFNEKYREALANDATNEQLAAMEANEKIQEMTIRRNGSRAGFSGIREAFNNIQSQVFNQGKSTGPPSDPNVARTATAVEKGLGDQGPVVKAIDKVAVAVGKLVPAGLGP